MTGVDLSGFSTFPINVGQLKAIPWSILNQWEANDLKDADDRDVTKLKNAILSTGFNFPFYIWKDHEYVIDGAGRFKAIYELESEGYAIPDLPCMEIDAPNLHAAKVLVLQASSEHGKITQDSFDSFIDGLDIASILDSIEIPDVDIPGLPKDEKKKKDDDSADDEEYEAFSKDGDIFQFGEHRFMVGSDNFELADDLVAFVRSNHRDVDIIHNGSILP